MRVIDLDNEYHNWKISGHISKNNDLRPRSKYHLRARNLIKEEFPTCQILEEVPVRARKGETLYLDFFVPLHNICIEVHGEQHYSYTSFYHGSRLGFAMAQKRDREKIEWCEKNGITILEFPYKENDDEWRERINNR